MQVTLQRTLSKREGVNLNTSPLEFTEKNYVSDFCGHYPN